MRGRSSTTRRESAPPFGIIASPKLIESPHSFPRSGLPLRQTQGTMPSADFCLLTPYVAMQGAAGLVMRRCLFRGSLEDSYPSTANGHAGFLVIRVNPFRTLLMSILPHGKQISPDKNVNLPCTTAAFTLPPRTFGLCCVVPTRPGAKPCMRFLSVSSHVCHPASFGPLLAGTPLPSTRTFGSIH